MKLSNKSIKNLIRGAIRFEEENGYLYADRGSINQIDYLNTNFKGRNFVEILMEGSSIFIKFKTDAEKISFNYNMPLILNPKCSIDLYVNDVPYKFVHVEDIKIKVENLDSIKNAKVIEVSTLNNDSTLVIEEEIMLDENGYPVHRVVKSEGESQSSANGASTPNQEKTRTQPKEQAVNFDDL